MPSAPVSNTSCRIPLTNCCKILPLYCLTNFIAFIEDITWRILVLYTRTNRQTSVSWCEAPMDKIRSGFLSSSIGHSLYNCNALSNPVLDRTYSRLTNYDISNASILLAASHKKKEIPLFQLMKAQYVSTIRDPFV